MICHGFKGGIGTASRALSRRAGGYIIGVLVQANQGRRQRLQVNGVPVGEAIPPEEVPVPWGPVPGRQDSGSIIVVVATDIPLLPIQCARLAQRAGLGVARVGGAGEHSSGDVFLAFSTGNLGASGDPPPGPGAAAAPTISIQMLTNDHITEAFYAVVEATEEAIVNALLGAETMTGRDGP
jgi:D-aminopeptidase